MKFNKRKRIKLDSKLINSFRAHEKCVVDVYQELERLVGLRRTSARYCCTQCDVLVYFQVVDTKKYFLAKIKYGFI